MSTTSKQSTCIVAMMLAMDNNKLIGKGDSMPWHIPGEQAYFKSVTMGKPIIMGRKTFDSIGKPLPGRPNFVVTRNKEWAAEGVYTCTSLLDAIDGAVRFYKALDAKSAELSEANESGAQLESAIPHEIMVIGGAGLCRDAMPMTERIYLTHIDHEYEGDIWFDSFEWDDWDVTSKKELQHEQLAYAYYVLDRPST